MREHPGSPGGRPGSQESGSAPRYAVAAIGYCLAALLLKPFYPYLDFGVFYSAAIEKILAGNPLDLYSFAAYAPGSALPLPLTYPPHYFFYLAPWYALGSLIGIADFPRATGFSLGQAWMLVPALPFDLLLVRETLRGIERLRGPIPEPRRWVLFLCLLFSPLLWLSTVRYGHAEAMMVVFLLLAIRLGDEGRPISGGIFWGLGMAVKLTAAAPALVYFCWAARRRGLRETSLGAAAAGAVLFLPILPYLALRFEPAWRALFGFEAIRPVGGIVLWKLLPGLEAPSGAIHAVILAASGALGLILARREGTRFLDAGGAAALVLSQVILLLLAKAVFVWYGLALAFFSCLAFPPAREARRLLPVVPLAIAWLLWLLQSGGWVGEAATAAVRIRSGIWVVFLGVLGYLAGRTLIKEGELSPDPAQRDRESGEPLGEPSQ
jgi:hypothetical protein